MKKELKILIKKLKLSDDQIINLINASATNDDIMNEAEDPNASNQDEDLDNADKDTAKKENPKKMTMKTLQETIIKSVADALKADKKGKLLPSQKPIKKTIPNASQEDEITLGDFIMV